MDDYKNVIIMRVQIIVGGRMLVLCNERLPGGLVGSGRVHDRALLCWHPMYPIAMSWITIEQLAMMDDSLSCPWTSHVRMMN